MNYIIASLITFVVLLLVLFINKKDKQRKRRENMIDNISFAHMKIDDGYSSR